MRHGRDDVRSACVPVRPVPESIAARNSVLNGRKDIKVKLSA